MHWIQVAILFILGLTGCTAQESPRHPWCEMPGRDDPSIPVYRARVPASWEARVTADLKTLADTTKPNAEFFIRDGERQVRLVIHTFPSESLERRIPPQAQVARWERQFSTLNPISIVKEPKARGGFAGLYFEAEGTLTASAAPIRVMGWAMQLDQEHYHVLTYRGLKNLSADYTLKVTGDPSLMEGHREEIEVFARSFELIQEIPSRQ